MQPPDAFGAWRWWVSTNIGGDRHRQETALAVVRSVLESGGTPEAAIDAAWAAVRVRPSAWARSLAPILAGTLGSLGLLAGSGLFAYLEVGPNGCVAPLELAHRQIAIYNAEVDAHNQSMHTLDACTNAGCTHAPAAELEEQYRRLADRTSRLCFPLRVSNDADLVIKYDRKAAEAARLVTLSTTDANASSTYGGLQDAIYRSDAARQRLDQDLGITSG